MQSREASHPAGQRTSPDAASEQRFFDRGLRTAVRDAALLTLVGALLAIGVNVVHPRGIPLVARRAYDILVPCPEPGGAVSPLLATDARVRASDSFRVDARGAQAFTRWHLPGARRLTFDYLDPTPKPQLRAVARAAARSKARRVVVYGDGDDPDSGEQLGKELSGSGLKNVFFVRGGARALQDGSTTGTGTGTTGTGTGTGAGLSTGTGTGTGARP